MYGLALILTVILMGGAIAYIGDKLGTKVGKRKLSIFGLRPKHTSIIVTIITGILISGVTMGLLTLSSKDVRTALFGMESLKAELAQLAAEVAGKNTELAAARQALAEKTAEYAALNDKIVETTAKLHSVTAELATVSAERDRISAALDQVRAQYQTAQGDLAKAQKEINELDARIADLTQSKSRLEQDIDRLNQLTATLSQHMQTIREGVLVYRAGEVLNRGIVPAGLSRTEATEALKALMVQSNKLLLERFGLKDKDLEVLWIAQADFDQAVERLQQSDSETVVRLTATGNTVYGEPVIGKFDFFPNRLIYPAKALVYSEVVNAGSSQSQSEETFLAFLRNVNAAAVKQGILADPLQGTVGVMSGAQLYETVNQMRHYGGQVKLTALADGDVYTLGPLKLKVQVEEVK